MVRSGAMPREPIEGRLRARPLPDQPAVVRAGVHELPLPGAPPARLAVPPVADGATVSLTVMLHGAGGDAEQGLRILAGEAARRGGAVLAPKSREYTWDLLVGGLGPDVAALDEALAKAFVRCPVDPERVAIAGFSDGASYALSVGLANGDLFSHVLAFSPGFLAPPMIVGSPAIYVSHGVHDRVLTIGATSRRLVASLERSGYDVRYEEFDGGHEVPPERVRHAYDRLDGTGAAAGGG